MSKSRSVSSDGHTQWWGKPPQLSWSPWSLLFAPPSTVSPSSSPCAHAPKAPSSKPCRHWHAWWSFPPMLWSIQQGIDGLCRQSFPTHLLTTTTQSNPSVPAPHASPLASSHHASEALLVKQWKQMWSNCELEKTLRKSNVSTGTMRSTLNPTLLTIHHSKTFNIQKKCVFSQSHLPPLLPLLAGCPGKRHEEVVDEHQNVRCGADSDPKLKSNSLNNNYHPHPKTENPRKVRDKISPKTVRHRTSKVKMKHWHWTTT